MQNESSSSLSKYSRGKRGNSTARGTKGTYDTQAANLLFSSNRSGEDDSSTRIDRSEEQSDDCNGHGISDYIRNKPDEQLEDCSAEDDAVDEDLLSDFVGWVGEKKTS
jgi:hypothetical protein